LKEKIKKLSYKNFVKNVEDARCRD
jgi:hypothetical protein